ncbi:ACT domain-containing protein [Enterococcus sp. BWT-B8]|uniref:ACT domain-containing protein n=1 Tax=Enterococcus sp. BWT-B8 TaxID=2885157 RepID=UPI001E4BCC46|nr:ACT domain-containing protein [Enterococcus sp. BWT-B8]MCB5950814.1 ACT domain-containing protein [Enterococcus sp. BWT-B8]
MNQLKKREYKLSPTGISIGGESIQISEINGFKRHLSITIPTYLVAHWDMPGLISKTAGAFSEYQINIAMLTITRESKGEKAIIVLEVDSQEKSAELINKIQTISGIHSASFFF